VRRAAGADVVEIAMQGAGGGAKVWYDPVGLHVRPGQTVRWSNRDAGNAHTVTAYHPAIFGRPRRIPAAARPWDSDMVGRIVVGAPPPGAAEQPPDPDLAPLPEVALNGFPPVAEILERGVVRRG
jgi:hypothetical protein